MPKAPSSPIIHEFKSGRDKLIEDMRKMGAASFRSGGFFISTMDAVTQELRGEGFINQ